jgi:hypothetical protein
MTITLQGGVERQGQQQERPDKMQDGDQAAAPGRTDRERRVAFTVGTGPESAPAREPARSSAPAPPDRRPGTTAQSPGSRGMSNAIVPQARWECTPWAAEATSILPAGPAACQRLASPVGSRRGWGWEPTTKALAMLEALRWAPARHWRAARNGCKAGGPRSHKYPALWSCIWGSAKHHYATLGFQCLI